MANILSNLRAPEGAVTKPLRKGRGVGSGLGKTAGKGQKGQKARHPGNFGKLGFQGGQTPIQRRLPKRGFRNPFPTDVFEVNLSTLVKTFDPGAVVDVDSLRLAGVLNRRADRIKVLGVGEMDRKLVLKVHAISAGARSKVEAAGGTIELIPTTRTAEGNVSA